MFYWLIPYLVAYNVSESTNWKDGPVHWFASEVNTRLTLDTEKRFIDMFLIFACQPVDISTIECEIKNATSENYITFPNNRTQIRPKIKWTYDELLIPVRFNVNFDKNGVAKVNFPKPIDYYRKMVVRSIFESLNIGIDLTGKKYGNYTQMEESIYGNCTANFSVQKNPRRPRDTPMIPNPAVTRMSFHPFSTELLENETIAIIKERKMDSCHNKTPYLFGYDDYHELEDKVSCKSDIGISLNAFYMGRNRFNVYLENHGSMKIGTKDTNSNTKKISGKVFETIKFALVTINDVKDDLPF